MKWKAAIILVVLAAVGGYVSYVFLSGPRMYDQPHLRAFQAEMPPTPPGSVPVTDAIPPLPSAEEAKTLANPIPVTEANLARGKVYYEYYCRFCHGDKGDGNGPVGESYIPKPADLRSEKIRAYSDGALLRAMLLGTGHEPVLERTVPPEHRWYTALYARHLGSAPLPPKPGP